jgi:hypothetical protein
LGSDGRIVQGDQLEQSPPDPIQDTIAQDFRSDGYGSIHGPYATSEVISVAEGDAISLEFKAVGTEDDYEVFGLLRKVDGNGDVISDSLADGNNLVLFAERGTDTTTEAATADTGGYRNVTYENLPEGAYRFQFVGGTYDGTGGLAIGSNLYIDNIRLISDVTTSDEVATSIARQVTYQSTAEDTPNRAHSRSRRWIRQVRPDQRNSPWRSLRAMTPQASLTMRR